MPTATLVPETAQRAPVSAGGQGAKARILETASALFYAEGINAVGIDRLISESHVTKATFYKHYGSKDNLVLAYMRGRHEDARAEFDRIVSGTAQPEDALRALAAAIAEDASRRGFRGCAFMNAAAEFSQLTHPVRVVVADHRDWYTERITELFSGMGSRRPGDAADEFVLARDGVMSGAYAGDSVAAVAAFGRAVERVLETAGS